MKKLLSALGTVLLFPAMALASFSDVPASNQFYDAINYVQSNGIVQGYPDKSFRPDQLINRAEFTTIIIKSLYSADKYQNCTPAIKFPDVVVSDWFHPYICMTVNQGIAHGYPDNTFKPANNLNFAEISKMLVEAYDIGSSTAGGPWYQQYVVAIEKLNAKPASIKQPDQQITRGEMAEMIYKLKDNVPVWANKIIQPGATEEVKGTYYTTTTSGSALYFMPDDKSILDSGEQYMRLLNYGNLIDDKSLYGKFGFTSFDPIANCQTFYGTATILAEKYEKEWDNSWSYQVIEVKEKTQPLCGEFREFAK